MITTERRKQLIQQVAPLFGQLGRKWKSIEDGLKPEPGLNWSVLRDWYRHNLDGAKNVWDAARAKATPTDLLDLWKASRDEFLAVAQDALESDRLREIAKRDLAEALQLFSKIAKTCQEFGLDTKDAIGREPTSKQDGGKVISIADRIAEMKSKQA